ncbi:MAG: phosphatase PAP2 family protein [Actinobacteria bacterium]|nr:phosphatase PAP2 family protein [Actinomycetota bacterium]
MRRAWATFQRRDGLKQTAIVLAALGVYEAARTFIEPDWTVAIANAERIVELERGLSFAWEQSLQRAFLGVPELVEAMNVFYFLGHFVLTTVFFLWLYRSSSEGFRSFRDGFIAATAIAVLIHWWFPTAPPRAVGDLGIMDTLRVFWDIDIGSPHTSAFTNPVAAVPSLHAGWAVGVGLGLVRFAKHRALRVLGVVYPAAVVLTIVVTGNHFIFDALAGIAVLGAGFLIAGIPKIRRRHLAILEPATRGGAVR